MTNWTPRTVNVSLSFLGSGTFTAEICEDASDVAVDPKHAAIRKQNVRGGQTLQFHLASGRGCTIRFVPRKGK